jgi:hypothetical protein
MQTNFNDRLENLYGLFVRVAMTLDPMSCICCHSCGVITIPTLQCERGFVLNTVMHTAHRPEDKSLHRMLYPRTFTWDQGWRGVLEKARYCDYIVTESPEVFVLADAMQIPCSSASTFQFKSTLVGRVDVTNPGLYSMARHGWLGKLL